jgi:hypothetical protein
VSVATKRDVTDVKWRASHARASFLRPILLPVAPSLP